MIKLKKGEIINLLDKFDYYMMKGEINHVTTKQIYQNNEYLYYHHDDDYYNLHLLWLLCT